MRRMGLSQNASGNPKGKRKKKKNRMGVAGFFLSSRPTKREYNQKIARLSPETISGALLSECQTVGRVASLRDPAESALFDSSLHFFPPRSLSLSPSLSPLPHTLPCLSLRVLLLSLSLSLCISLPLSLFRSLCAALICR